MYSILEKGYQTLQKSIGEQKKIHFNQGKGCRHLIILVLFLLITFTGSAATYYVSNSGNDSKAGTTPETAWQTISKVNQSKFAPGDQILFLRDGVWIEQLIVPSSGTSGNPITFGAYGSGAKPIINADNETFGIVSSARSYIKLSNLNVKGATNSNIELSHSNNITIDNCVTEGAGKQGIDVASSTHYTISNNTIKDNGNDGIWLAYGADNGEVYNNVISGNGIGTTGDRQAIGLWISKDISIHDNNITHTPPYAPTYCFEFCSNADYNRNIRLYNNKVKTSNCKRILSVFKGDYYVYNNEFIGDGSGYGIFAGDVEFREIHLFAYNNTIDSTTRGIDLYEDNFLPAHINPDSRYIVKNNIVTNASVWNIVVNRGLIAAGQVTINNNLYDDDSGTKFRWNSVNYNFANWKTNSRQDANGLVGDPLFLGKGDFRLQTGSPAINAGTNVGLIHDILGNPILGSPDIGCYENPESVNLKQGSLGTHYIPAEQGENDIKPMNLTIVSATIEDLPLSADDEIAVFIGDICVASAKLTQSIDATNSATTLTISASQVDGSKNGYITNDTIVFKIWNNQTQKELQVNAAIYRNDVPSWKTNGRYSPGATAVVELESYPVYTQQIEILKGYNLISTYVSPQNSSVSAVTRTLIDQGSLITMQDEAGNSFENWGAYGGWINQLGSMKETEGYQLQAANNCTLQVTGRSIATPLDISLQTGWNIISYPHTDLVNAMDVVQSLIDQNKLIKVQDEQGNSIENWGLYGGWKNGIGNLIPGKAYKVKMSADAVLTFQKSYPKSALVTAKPEQTEFYQSSVEGNGTDHMNINITDLNTIGLSAGDELAAFDGAVCVATSKINEANVKSGSACLAASLLTDTQKPNGYKVGDLIQIRTWNKLSGAVSKVNAEVITGQMNYEKNASVLVKMKSASITTGITNLDDVVKIDVFPNPCQGKFTVRLNENPEQGSRIDVLDISGHTVASRLITEPSEVFNLGNQPSGLYLVRTTIGTSQKNYKLIIN